MLVRPSHVQFLSFLLLSVLLTGMEGRVPGDEEQKLLLQKESQLAARVASLRKEHEYLVFRKAVSASDSKYIVLDLPAGSGTLRYRNRTLRSFSISVPAALQKADRRGSYRLTEKIDGQPEQRALVFQDLFIVRGRQRVISPAEKKMPSMVMSKSDMAAIFYALDLGSLVYLRI